MADSKRVVWVTEQDGTPVGAALHIENVHELHRHEYVRYIPAAEQACAVPEVAAEAGKAQAEWDTEAIAARVHEAWVEQKRASGFSGRKSESGEELMVPYEQLSEAAKELDRATVRAVLDALPSPPKGDR